MKLLDRNKQSGPQAAVSPPRPRRRFKKKTVVIALLLAALIAGGAFGAKALFFTEATRTALSEKTTYGSLSTTIEGTATTLPADSTTITVASTATIEEVFVSAGDTVAVGDPLYTQDDSELDDEIEAYESQIEDYQDQLTASYEQIDTLQDTLSGLTVSAPFSGRLTEVNAEVGDEVQKGARLALLVDDSAMKLTQYFSYAYEDQVYIGMTAGVSVAELMTNLAGTVTDIQKVERITAEGTRCFAVTVTVENPGALTEGMTGAGYLVASSGEKIYPAIEGALAYSASKVLTAAVSGELTAAKAAAYQKVDKGDTLFVIDGSDYRDQMDSANQKITQLQDKIAVLQEKIAETGEKRSDYTVVSPIAGKVIQVQVRAGEKPRQAGMTAVSVYNLDTMEISANIDELDIDNVTKGMAVRVVQSGSERDTTYEGTVTAISYEATNSSGTAYFPITIEIPSKGQLAAGVNVSYTITVGDPEEGVLAPISALKKTDSGTYLFVKADARPDNAEDLEGVDVPKGFYAVPVEVGVTSSRYARILSGVGQDAEVFTRYQNSAPTGGSTTSEGQEEGVQSFPDFPGGNGNWNSNGGGRPNFSGGGNMGGMMPAG